MGGDDGVGLRMFYVNANDRHLSFRFFVKPYLNLVEEPEDLSSALLPLRLVVGHDTETGGQDDVSELAGWEEVHNPFLNLVDGYVKAGGDHTAFVKATVQLDDDLAGAVVVDDLKLSDVSYYWERKR